MILARQQELSWTWHLRGGRNRPSRLAVRPMILLEMEATSELPSLRLAMAASRQETNTAEEASRPWPED